MKKSAEHPISAVLGGIMLFVCLALGTFFAWDATRQLIDSHDAALFGELSWFMLAWLGFLALIVLRFLIFLGMAVLDWFDSLRPKRSASSDDELPFVTVISIFLDISHSSFFSVKYPLYLSVYGSYMLCYVVFEFF